MGAFWVLRRTPLQVVSAPFPFVPSHKEATVGKRIDWYYHRKG